MPWKNRVYTEELPPKILIIDDDIDMRNVLMEFFRENALLVDCADTGEMAEKLYKPNIYDLLLIDIRLPDTRGDELFMKLKKKDPYVTGIILTGNTDLKGAMRAANEPGIVAFESKPFDLFRLYAIISDAISRRRAEAKLRENEARYREFVENFRGIAFEMDEKGELLILHGAVEEICGYKTAEIMGGSPAWAEIVQDEFKDMVVYVSHEKSTDTKVVYDEREYLINNKNGDSRWVHETLQYVRKVDGSLEKIRGAIFDITKSRESELALYESERRHNDFLESLEDIVWRVDVNERKLSYANSSVERVYGIPIAEFYNNSNMWFEMVHPEDRERVSEYSANMATSTQDIEYRIVRRDGEVRWVYDRPAIMKDKSGNVTHVGGVMSDITRQKVAEMEKEELARQLTQAQKMDAIGQLAAGIAHDFNNILAAIMGNSSYGMSIVDENSPGYLPLKEIMKVSHVAKNLISKLLSFARENRPDITRVSIHSVVSDLMDLLSVTKPRDVQIYTELASEIPSLFVDRTQIMQSMLNICNNARDAMPDGGKLTIKAGVKKVSKTMAEKIHNLSAGNYCLLEISDTGHGIPNEIVNKIFDPFFTTKDVDKGTGLGLSVTMGIINANGGHITVDSNRGEGTTFRIYLPLADKEQQSESLNLKNEVILIVNNTDDKTLLKAETSLEKNGFKVIAEKNPENVPSLLSNTPGGISLLLMDSKIPVIKNRGLNEICAEISPDTRTVLFSNYDYDSLKMDFVAAGIYGLLPQNCNDKELCVKVSNILASRNKT